MLPAFSFQDAIWAESRRCAIQKKEHGDGLCTPIAAGVARIVLHDHVTALQVQGLAVDRPSGARYESDSEGIR